MTFHLGAERARELRVQNGGWPGDDLHWLGCPPEEE